MAGKQFTKCVSKADYDGLCGVWPDLLYAVGYGLFGGLMGFVAGLIAAAIASQLIPDITDAGFQCIIWIATVTAFLEGFAEGLCERYENQRLICIAPERSAVGRIAFHKTGPSKGVPAGIDNDYTLNLVLVPHTFETDKDTVWNDGGQGQLLLARQFPDLPYGGYEDRPETLHCEFEGSRMRAICNAIKIAAPLFGLAACACLYFALAWWVCLLILLGLALLTFAAGWAAGEDGSPADAADDPESGTLEDGDCIVVRGPHIYDAGHCQGWHEIHPVLHVQKLCSASDTGCVSTVCFEADPSDPVILLRVNRMVAAWDGAIGQTTDPLTIERQKMPENRWCFHPDVDGCRVPEPIP